MIEGEKSSRLLSVGVTEKGNNDSRAQSYTGFFEKLLKIVELHCWH